MTQPTWSKSVTLGVADEVRHWRKVRGMSTEQLAARCAALGSPVHRSVLANLESGRRENVTVGDLVTLGRALGVPPLLLLYPAGRVDDCEPFPGERRSVWEAAKLFTGEMATGDSAADGALDLEMFREHDRLAGIWQHEHEQPSGTSDDVLGGRTPGVLAEAMLLGLRARMRERGLNPPPLPSGLAVRLAGAE